jgi:hypothetical protein
VSLAGIAYGPDLSDLRAALVRRARRETPPPRILGMPGGFVPTCGPASPTARRRERDKARAVRAYARRQAVLCPRCGEETERTPGLECLACDNGPPYPDDLAYLDAHGQEWFRGHRRAPLSALRAALVRLEATEGAQAAAFVDGADWTTLRDAMRSLYPRQRRAVRRVGAARREVLRRYVAWNLEHRRGGE